MRDVCVVALAGLVGVLASASAEAQWGSLKGKVTLDGEVPAVKLLVRKGDETAKDAPVCAAQDVPDDSLAVDKDSKGIANVAVWLVKKPAKIHPDLVKPKDAIVDFDQVGCRFVPHILVLRTDQKVRLLNGDNAAHNTACNPLKGVGFNPLIAANDRKGVIEQMKVAERLPVEVKCSIHAWMKAYWVVVDHPYATVTDKNGYFEIKDLPEGDHEFKVWHETPGYLYKDKKDPKKGLLVTIKSGETLEVPEIKVKPETLTGEKK